MKVFKEILNNLRGKQLPMLSEVAVWLSSDTDIILDMIKLLERNLILRSKGVHFKISLENDVSSIVYESDILKSISRTAP